MNRHTWLAVALAGVGVVLLAGIVAVVTTRQSGTKDLTWPGLRNASYPSDFPRGKTAPLTDGYYEEEFVPGAATKLVIRMAPFAAFGLLDDDSAMDAAVILISNPGGSGTFINLVPVLNRNGSPQPTKSVLLGDRIAVRALRIENRRISVRMRVRSPSDPFVKLSREVTRSYTLSGDGLVLESESTQDVPSQPPDSYVYSPRRIDVTPRSGRTTVQGTLKPGGIDHYIARVEAGQEARLVVRSEFGNAILSVFGLIDGTQLVSRTDYATTWSGRIPTTQDYAIKIITVAGHDLQYTLSVEVLPAPEVPLPTATTALTATPRRIPTATPWPTGIPTASPTSVTSRPPAPTPTSSTVPIPTYSRTPATPNPQAPTPSSTPPAALNGTIPLLWSGNPKLIEHPLSELSAEASQFLEARDSPWGVAVIVPGEQAVYVANADRPFETASVVKVLVMLAVLNRAAQEHRYVGEDELELLWPMITESDNDSTTALWNQIGGGRAVKGYLAASGLSGITPYDGQYWGLSAASARGMSIVMARLAFGDLLDQPSRRLALDLLLNVIPEQRWGMTAGAEDQRGRHDTVGLKNGWYPEEGEGWRVNSTGFVVSSLDNQPAYAVAVMTNLQTSWDYGIGTIEGAASRIHSAVHR